MDDQTKIRQLEHTVRLLEARNEDLLSRICDFRNSFLLNPDPVFLADIAHFSIVDTNNSMEEIFGYSRHEIIGKPLPALFQDSEEDFWQFIANIGEKSSIRDFEVKFKKKTGAPVDCSINANLFSSEMHGMMILGSIRDITERKKLEREREIAHDVISRSPIIAFVGENVATFPIEFIGDGFEKLGGDKGARIENGILLLDTLMDGGTIEKFVSDLSAFYSRGDGLFTGKYPIFVGGEKKWYEITVAVDMNGANEIMSYLGIAWDITEIQEAYRKQRELAEIDGLTRLYNRRTCMELLYNTFVKAVRQKKRIAALYIDLDGFKGVNDTYGHDMGDALLTEVSKRFDEHLRKSDIVGRMGGDEFLVILTEVKRKGAEAVARKLNRCLALAYRIEDIEIETVSASIGIGEYRPGDADRKWSMKQCRQEADRLVKMADNAMYKAKTAGKNQFAVWDPSWTD